MAVGCTACGAVVRQCIIPGARGGTQALAYGLEASRQKEKGSGVPQSPSRTCPQ
jgi:hypothetical protein